MGYFLTLLGGFAFLAAVGATYVAFHGGTDIQLILGAIYGVLAAVLIAGGGIIVRMDERNSKKDVLK